ncbi:MAG: hypothetical protein R3195_10455 [Gemmatimonadota bacterium]|nr:hypothetical protein [Gemmatimonadota bacterium]
MSQAHVPDLETLALARRAVAAAAVVYERAIESDRRRRIASGA